jgi:hypothetical protein
VKTYFVISNHYFVKFVYKKDPKLVVGIVVDQMKMEYLYRFQMIFSNDGFKRLMGMGIFFKICILYATHTVPVMHQFIQEQPPVHGL